MKKIFTAVLIFILLGLGIVAYIYYPRLNLITGFAAKNQCSCVFEANRDPGTVASQDNGFDPVDLAEYEIDYEKRSASATVFGLKKRTAQFNPGLGCTLLPEGSDKNDLPEASPERVQTPVAAPYPYGHESPQDTVFAEVDTAQLEIALENAFLEEHKTRAVVVLYKDHLIAERYAPGFSEETKLLGWSMTKSITSAVLGVLEKQGEIDLEQDHLFPEWEEDERAQITINDLLHMNSGLAWEEDYTKISDVTNMLFLAEDMSEVQLYKPLVGEPGSIWNYSSGISNLLSGFIRDQFNSYQEYLDFWYKELIDKIGMHSMTLETDLAGNYVGSSYSWATARDWAKFGLLYLSEGNWNGEQIINKDWIDYTVKPVEGSNGEYGAHFWLNAGGLYPDVPRDLFSANGFQGQHVFIIPSKDLVVVRLGLVEHPDFNINTFLREVIKAVDSFSE
ncbi:serine hydrolase domain-containing protein [Salinimicrobium sediminilitoris]|uniref:serine hydrolase domain-containing protein n=1 Tax=Salinimicrobium sediminilitoris TaxID=2876715 RepID=UPI001E5C0C47|nr:serine hydrolase [Salinimicrobium sediminilitoris]MCC8361128.1 beta-lactamase family protein [Salinimicrobium sediminilitoris]